MSPVVVALGLSVVAIACFGWSVFGAFRSGEEMTSGYDMVRISSIGSWFIQVWLLQGSAMSFAFVGYWVGLLLVAAAIVLFWACVRITRARKLTLVFSQDLPEHIYAVGPYAYVRHPFYLSYLMAYFGMAMIGEGLWLYVVAALMTLVYFMAARFEESKFESSALAAEYAEYRRRAGMFLPRIGRLFGAFGAV